MARFTTVGGSGDGTPGAPGSPGADGADGADGANGANGADGADGKDSLFLGTWNSVTEFLAAYQGGPVGLADGDWWAFVKDNTNPNKIYVVREDPASATGWVIDDNEHFVLPQGPQGDPGTPGADGSDGADGEDGAPGERGTSSLSWTYKIDVTNSLDRDPGNDYIGFATLPFTSSAQILVDDNPFGINTTLHDLFLGIQNGYLTLTSQTDPSAYATYQITSSVAGTATNETSTGSYVVFNVSSYTGYGSFIHDELVTLSISIAGPQGEPGADGADGADAIWNFTGEYNGGSSYAVGDLATYNGQLWYRTHANGGTVGNTPSEGFIWALLAAKGADGTNGTNGTPLTSRGAWTDSENYAINDIVTFEGSAYVCIVGVTAGTDVAPYPQHIGAYWNLLVSGSTVDTGQITFLGVYIMGAGADSGDGLGNGTIKLMPDVDLVQTQYHEDQYLIIDPTSPNHIHIRAGGVQDASTADLFLGAERNNVIVSDEYNNVKINSRPDPIVNNYGNSNQASNTEFMVASGTDIIVGDTVRLYTGGPTYTVTAVTQEYPYAGLMTVVADGLSFITGEAYTFTREQYLNTWIFEEDGTLYGPAMGGLRVTGLETNSTNPFWIYSADDIILNAVGGEYIGANGNANNQIATIGDLPTGATGTFESSDGKTVTVTNGIITSII